MRWPVSASLSKRARCARTGSSSGAGDTTEADGGEDNHAPVRGVEHGAGDGVEVTTGPNDGRAGQGFLVLVRGEHGDYSDKGYRTIAEPRDRDGLDIDASGGRLELAQRVQRGGRRGPVHARRR